MADDDDEFRHHEESCKAAIQRAGIKLSEITSSNMERDASNISRLKEITILIETADDEVGPYYYNSIRTSSHSYP